MSVIISFDLNETNSSIQNCSYASEKLIDNRSLKTISARLLADKGRFLILLRPPISIHAIIRLVYFLFIFDSVKTTNKVIY